jgi:hypothetical protein
MDDHDFARAKDGYVALVPFAAEVGDAIMLVKGSRVPLIFRRKSITTWELIGSAYVPGLMKGERWDEGRCETVKIE